ncbi:MAG: hypothetical protein J0L82_10910 [Deltaproteobacteria bacterium]|nr:hypothetical protein [Deltaproteobacteria bacterium]
MKSFLLAAILVSSSPALACGPEVAQFIADVGQVTPLAGGACEFKIDLDLRKPHHQFSPMFTCPLDIDLLSTYPVRQETCTVQQGEQVSGVLVKLTSEADHLILE